MHSTAGETAAIAAPFLMAPRPPTRTRWKPSPDKSSKRQPRLSALDLIAVFNSQNRVTRSVGAFFTEYDLLVTPTLGQLPAPHGTLQLRRPRPQHEELARSRSSTTGPFTAVFNISGQPAISLPLAQSESGLPIGVQFVAPYGREDLLFQLAAQLEQAMPWKHRTPNPYVGRR